MAKEKINLVRLTPDLDERNMARLESRNYEQGYTKIPNSALPKTYREGLGAIFSALTGESMDPEGSSFAVKAENGIFKRLYAPAIFSVPTSEEEDAPLGLAIVWGDEKIPLFVDNGDIYTTEETKTNSNVKFSVREYGDWKNPAISVTVTEGDTAYSYPFVVRPADLNDKLSAEELEMLVENSTTEDIAGTVQSAPSGEGGGGLFHGPFVKVAHMPIGSYQITGYRKRQTQNYGMDYFLQARVEEPFVAPTGVRRGEEWVTEEVEVQDWCIVRPNTAMKKILAGDPVITEDRPAELIVTEHYTTKTGHDAAKVSLQCEFEESEDGSELSLSF